MQINYTQKHIRLSDDQKAYIEDKLDSLKKFRKVEDESTLIKVDVEFFDSKIAKENLSFTVNMIIPHATVRAEVDCVTIEEGIDLAIEKLRSQLEKYKDKH